MSPQDNWVGSVRPLLEVSVTDADATEGSLTVYFELRLTPATLSREHTPAPARGLETLPVADHQHASGELRYGPQMARFCATATCTAAVRHRPGSVSIRHARTVTYAAVAIGDRVGPDIPGDHVIGDRVPDKHEPDALPRRGH